MSLLEIGIDPDVFERPKCHEALTCLNAISRVDDAAVDESGDLGVDLCIAEIKRGLVKCAVGLLKASLRKLCGGRCLDQMIKQGIEIATRGSLDEIGIDRVGVFLDPGHFQPNLDSRVDQFGQSSPDHRRFLGPVGGHFIKRLARRGDRRQPQRRAVKMNLLMCLELGRQGYLVGSLALVNGLLGSAFGLKKVLRPPEFGLGKHALGSGLAQRGHAGLQLGDLLGHLVPGQRQVIIGSPDARHDCPTLRSGLLDLSLGNLHRREASIHGDLIRFGIELDEKLVLAHKHVVVNIDLDDRAGDSRRHIGDVASNVGVIGADGVQEMQSPWPQPEPGHSGNQRGCKQRDEKKAKASVSWSDRVQWLIFLTLVQGARDCSQLYPGRSRRCKLPGLRKAISDHSDHDDASASGEHSKGEASDRVATTTVWCDNLRLSRHFLSGGNEDEHTYRIPRDPKNLASRAGSHPGPVGLAFDVGNCPDRRGHAGHRCAADRLAGHGADDRRLLLVGGAAQLVGSFWTRDWSGFFLMFLMGVLYIVVGLLFLERPVSALEALTLLLACSLIVSGIFRIVGSLMSRFPQWGWVSFGGVLNLLLGIMIWRQWPVASFWVIGLFVGIDMIFNGWTWVMLALRLKSLPRASAAA